MAVRSSRGAPAPSGLALPRSARLRRHLRRAAPVVAASALLGVVAGLLARFAFDAERDASRWIVVAVFALPLPALVIAAMPQGRGRLVVMGISGLGALAGPAGAGLTGDGCGEATGLGIVLVGAGLAASVCMAVALVATARLQWWRGRTLQVMAAVGLLSVPWWTLAAAVAAWTYASCGD